MTTTDSLIAVAEARRDAALSEARRLDDWLKTARELAGAASSLPAVLTVRAGAQQKLFDQTGAAVGEKVMATQDAAAGIIGDLGRPVPTREMLEEMGRRGFNVGGKEPFATLITRLNRAPMLENHKPFGWRLKEPRQDIGAAGNAQTVVPAASDPSTHSGPVDPAAGGGI